MTTQPGETDDFKVSDHVRLLNEYLGDKKIDIVIANKGKIAQDIVDKYATLEQKDPVILDKENMPKNIQIISSDFVSLESGVIRHNVIKLSSYIFSSML